jgi:hypothetical protein
VAEGFEILTVGLAAANLSPALLGNRFFLLAALNAPPQNDDADGEAEAGADNADADSTDAPPPLGLEDAPADPSSDATTVAAPHKDTPETILLLNLDMPHEEKTPHKALPGESPGDDVKGLFNAAWFDGIWLDGACHRTPKAAALTPEALSHALLAEIDAHPERYPESKIAERIESAGPCSFRAEGAPAGDEDIGAITAKASAPASMLWLLLALLLRPAALRRAMMPASLERSKTRPRLRWLRCCRAALVALVLGLTLSAESPSKTPLPATLFSRDRD